MSVLDRFRSSRAGSMSLVKMLLALLSAVLGFLGLGRLERPVPPTPPAAVRPPAMVMGTDTVFHFTAGPRSGSAAPGTIYIDRITIPIQPGRIYRLRVRNGTVGGANRVTSAVTGWNGRTVIGATDLTATIFEANPVLAATPVDTLKMTVVGPAGSFVTVAVFSATTEEFTVFGANSYNIPSGTTKTYTPSFTKPLTAAPVFRLYVLNGDSLGANRVASAQVKLNGTTVLMATDFTSAAGSITKPVTLVAGTNALNIVLTGTVGKFITLRITATDTTPPALVVPAPAESSVTALTTLAVTGTLVDQSPLGVTVNGVAATVTNNTSFAGTATLSEGWNSITTTATDAIPKSATVVRHVRRDTQAPGLTVTQPVNNSYTKNVTVTVSGSVIDAGPVTVNTNGTPLTVTGATYTGTVNLAYGGNTLVTTAADQANNTTAVSRVVTRDSLLPALAVTSPANGATVVGDSVLVSGTVSDASPVTVTANGFTLPVVSNAFFRKIPVSQGTTPITTIASDAAGNTSVDQRRVVKGLSDLDTIATPLLPGAVTSLKDATAFLYTGANPIQVGVAAGTIQLKQAAVLRGEIVATGVGALSGVKVTIVGHPEFGYTLSRVNGWFDLAVNGGGDLTVRMEKAGYLISDRLVSVPWTDYVVLDSVTLIPPVARSTWVKFVAPIEVVRGDSVTDSSGTRQAVVMFRQGTTVSVKLPNGTTLPINDSIRVRATEYTADAAGPSSMPATLPPTSAYTYAAELSIDTALSLGATGVTFSQPVSVYLDNFLGLPVGYAIPFGTYDRATAKWVPEFDGLVVKLLSVTAGKADLQTDTLTGHVASAATLATLGISDAERTQLATTFAVGKVVWRTQQSHFSPGDWNLLVAVPAGARSPLQLLKKLADVLKGGCHAAHSDIGCDNQTLGMDVPITGSPYTLRYQSDRVKGYTAENAIDLQMSEDTLPPGVGALLLRVTIAGRKISTSYPPTPNLRVSFGWDGYDAYGRNVRWPQTATIERCYAYDWLGLVYIGGGGTGGGGGVQGFGAVFTSNMQGGEIFWQQGRQYFTNDKLCSKESAILGGWTSTDTLMGGWSVSAAHQYDPTSQTLYLGTGERRSARAFGNTLTVVAGVRDTGYTGDGGPATQARLYGPNRVELGPDGSLYIANGGRARISKVDPTGIITTFAGDGTGGICPAQQPVACGDGGPAAGIGSTTKFRRPMGMAFAPDGSLYIADINDARVRRVRPDGIIETVAGTGVQGSGGAGDGGLAINAQLYQPIDVAVAPDGSLLIVDYADGRLRRVSPSGTITTMVGGGTQSTGWVSKLSLIQPVAVAIAGPTTIWLAEAGRYRVDLLDLSAPYTLAGHAGLGVICNPAFYGTCGDAYGWAAKFNHITDIATSPDGGLYVADEGTSSIRKIGGTLLTGAPNGIATIAGQAILGVTQTACSRFLLTNCVPTRDGGFATQTALEDPTGLAVAGDGTVYLAEDGGEIVRTIRTAAPGLATTDLLLASQDGSQVYLFDQNGLHKRTLDALTGDTIVWLAHGSGGTGLSLTDAFGNALAVTHVMVCSGNTCGIPTDTTRIVANGQITRVLRDGFGHFKTIRNPAGETTRVVQGYTGLLDSLIDPRGGAHSFQYDALGRLVSDRDPAGSTYSLAETAHTDTSRTVTLTTGMGRVTTYAHVYRGTGNVDRSITDPAGLVTRATTAPDGTTTDTLPDGTVVTSVEAADPRFGPQSTFAKSVVTRLPSGLTAALAADRRDSLSLSTDPLSLVTQTDYAILNGKDTSTSVYTRATGRLVQTSPAGRQVFSILDSKGRTLSARVAGLDSVRFRYDAQGRLDSIVDGGRRTKYTYNASSGRLTSVTDPLARTTQFAYDSAGRVTTQTLPDGRIIGFSYDSSGNLTSLTPPGRPAHGFQYTSVDLAKQYDPPGIPGPKPTKYFYNLDKQVDSIVRPDSIAVKFAYDGAGRPNSVIFDRGTQNFGFSGSSGALTSIRTPTGDSLQFRYDGSLPTAVSWKGAVNDSVVVTYDSVLRVKSQAVHGAAPVSFGYDRDGMLTGAGALRLGRDPSNGLLKADTLGSVVGSYSYTSRGELKGYQIKRASTVLFGAGYVRDSLGRITAKTDTVNGTITASSFVYDSVGRLKSTTQGGTTRAYEYDLNGNRSRFTLNGGGQIVPTYDSQDRLQIYGGASYTYGSNGELRTKTVGSAVTAYTYDALGNLTHVQLPSGAVLDYLIDGQNRRVGVKLNGVLQKAWVYQNQLNPVAEFDGSGNLVSRFVYGSRANVPDYMLKGGNVYRIVSDHLGSVRLVVDTTTGNIAQRIDYDEFGVATVAAGVGFQPFGFAGGLTDDSTKLTRFGARDYDPSLGRWIAKDPARFGGGATGLYAYAANDPMNNRDPSGLSWFTPSDGQNALDFYRGSV